MKINIDDIPENGLEVDVTEEGKDIEALAGGKLDFGFAAPVKTHLEINRTDGDLYVAGEIKTAIRLVCSRCLKEFEHPLAMNFRDFFVKPGKEAKEKELKPEDMEVSYLSGPELDTTELVLSQLSLEVPMQPLCREDCKGLCPKCGADLNLGDCGCERGGKTDSKFAKLKDFKVK